MKRLFLFSGILTVLLCPSSRATIINIPDDYPTIQEGIDASTDRDTVLVQPGSYMEGVDFNGHNVVLGSLFVTTGDTSFVPLTIIDGSYAFSTVRFDNEENSNAKLIGLTLLASEYSGFNIGIFCEDAHPTISNNIIRDFYNFGPGAGILLRGGSGPMIVNNVILDNNSSENIYNGGGGISCQDHSSPLIIENIISSNMSDFGGGIYCGDSASAYILNNSITGNFAGFSGGGIFCTSIEPSTIHQNIITGNRALSSTGGGIFCSNSASIISENVIKNNIALDWYPYQNKGGGICLSNDSTLFQNNLISNNMSLYGGGVYCSRSNSTFANNCILGNTGDSLGGAFFCQYGSNIDVINSIIWSNHSPLDSVIYMADSSEIAITYSNVRRGWEGQGNVNVPPHFRNPAYGDYHLMSTACGDPYDSPCIDAGDPNILDSLLDCSWGLGEVRSDIGAYGGGDTLIVGIDDEEIPTPDRFMLFQNYPNPFNATTAIRYSMPEPADVKIDIFDILGRRVETIIHERQEAGYHHVIWNGGENSAGIYLCRIQAGDYSQTRKMILLK